MKNGTRAEGNDRYGRLDDVLFLDRLEEDTVFSQPDNYKGLSATLTNCVTSSEVAPVRAMMAGFGVEVQLDLSSAFDM